jgi:hypothetical protein
MPVPQAHRRPGALLRLVIIAACVVAPASLAGPGCRSPGDREAVIAGPLAQGDLRDRPVLPEAAGPFPRALPATSGGALDRYFPVGAAADIRNGALDPGPQRAVAPTERVSAFWPLDRYYALPTAPTETAVDALGGIFRYRRTPAGSREEVALSPLFYFRDEPAIGETAVDVLWPLFTYRKNPDGERIWLLPLLYYNRFRKPDGTHDKDGFVMPFILFGEEEFPPDTLVADRLMQYDTNRDGVLGADELHSLPYREWRQFDADSDRRIDAVEVMNTVDQNGDGTIERDEAVAVLGTPERTEEYFAVFPFAGTLRGFLLTDWLEFYLFPLFYHHKKGDYDSWYFPWPIVHYGTGGGRESFHVLPLFSMDVKRELIFNELGERVPGPVRREAYSILWPFIQWQNIYGTLNTSDNPRDPNFERIRVMHSAMVFPLYARQETLSTTTTSLLWPFFNVVERSEDNYIAVDAPWPVFRYAQGDRDFELRIWPLFHEIRRTPEPGGTDSLYSLSLFWPLVHYHQTRTGRTVETNFKFIPLFWHSRIDHLHPGGGDPAASEVWTKFWPVAGYTKDRDGTEKLEILSPIPEAYVEGIENNWALFWRLFYWERNGDGSREHWRALGPLIQYDRTETGESFDFHPFFQHRSGRTRGPMPREYYSNDILYGLFGWGRDQQGDYLRLLWGIRIDLGGADDDDDPQANAAGGD